MSTKSTLLYIGTTLLALAFVATLPSPVKALGAEGGLNKQARLEARASASANFLSTIIQRGDNMIAERLASLQKLLQRVNADKKLSDADKASITNDINTTIAGLNALKVKIDQDTTTDAARADVKSIITNFHIYVMYEPKIRLLIVINDLTTVSSRLNTLAGKVQTLVTNLKNQGKDITTAQSALDDITAQLTAINSLLSTDKALVNNVNFGTTDPQSIFVQVRKDLATARQDFAKIRSDFATIRQFFRINIPKGTVSLKPSPASQSAK